MNPYDPTPNLSQTSKKTQSTQTDDIATTIISQTLTAEERFKHQEHQILTNFLHNLRILFTDHQIPSIRCFISYAWKPKDDTEGQKILHAQIDNLTRIIESLGAYVSSDRTTLLTQTLVDWMIQEVSQAQYVILAGSPDLKSRLALPGVNNIKIEYEAIQEKLRSTQGANALVPVLLEGEREDAFPDEILSILIRDLSKPETFYETLFARRPVGLIPVLFNLTEKTDADLLKNYDQLVSKFMQTLALLQTQNLPQNKHSVSTQHLQLPYKSTRNLNQIIPAKRGCVKERRNTL